MKTNYSKSKHSGQKAETHLGKWWISTTKRMTGSIQCVALLCDELGNGMMRYTSDSPRHALTASQGRATAAEIKRVHEAGLAMFRTIEPAAFPNAAVPTMTLPFRPAPSTITMPPLFKQHHSPWGQVDHTSPAGDLGLLHHGTASHGGIFVPDEWLPLMPAPYRNANKYGGGNWFEEDCEWALVALSFPSGFSEKQIVSATRTVIDYHPHEYMAVTGITLETSQSSTLKEIAFLEATREKYVVTSATSSTFDGRENVPAGLVGCFAVRGGRLPNGQYASKDFKHVLVPSDEYDSRDRNGFILEHDYPEWPLSTAAAA